MAKYKVACKGILIASGKMAWYGDIVDGNQLISETDSVKGKFVVPVTDDDLKVAETKTQAELDAQALKDKEDADNAILAQAAQIQKDKDDLAAKQAQLDADQKKSDDLIANAKKKGS